MSVKFVVNGPIFKDPESIVETQRKAMMSEITREGVKALAERFTPSPAGVLLSVERAGKKVSKGNYKKSIMGFVGKESTTISSAPTRGNRNAVYGDWLEGTSSRNQTTRFKGYNSFRIINQWMNDELVPRIAKKYEDIIANKLNG